MIFFVVSTIKARVKLDHVFCSPTRRLIFFQPSPSAGKSWIFSFSCRAEKMLRIGTRQISQDNLSYPKNWMILKWVMLFIPKFWVIWIKKIKFQALNPKKSPFLASFVSSRMLTNVEDFVGKNLRRKYCPFWKRQEAGWFARFMSPIPILTTKKYLRNVPLHHFKVLILRSDVLDIKKRARVV